MSTARRAPRAAAAAARFETLGRSAERAAEFLRTLAHTGRLRIVCALMAGEKSASQLVQSAHVAAPALSQQAIILESAGLIARRREGRSVMYRLASRDARALALLLHEMFCGPAPSGGRRTAKKRGTNR